MRRHAVLQITVKYFGLQYWFIYIWALRNLDSYWYLDIADKFAVIKDISKFIEAWQFFIYHVF
jgi:hypothetical protein